MAGSISFPGIGSGLNGSSIADALYDQLTLQNAPRQNQISSLQNENSALDQLNTLLLDLGSTVDAVSSLNGGASAKSVTSSNSDVATAIADTTAQSASYDLTVSQLASNATGSFSGSFSGANDTVLEDGDVDQKFEFTVGQGGEATGFTVNVSKETTAQDFVNQINEQSGGAVNASLVNLGTSDSPDYRITFSTTQTGLDSGSLSVVSSVDDGDQSKKLGTSTVSQATNAEFSISGIEGTITRGSNAVGDVIEGVTFSLEGTGSATLNVQSDSESSQALIESFVSAYNSLVSFVNEEDAVTVTQQGGETVNVRGSLASTNVDDSAINQLKNILLSTTSEDGSKSLASLGVSTNRDGTLSFDKDAFQTSFDQNPEAANQVLTGIADQLGGVQGVVNQYTGYGNSIDLAQEANGREIENLNNTIAQVERGAASRQQGVQQTFSKLEGILAQLNAESGYLSSLLKF